MFQFYFSNSLIIHDQNTKEITTISLSNFALNFSLNTSLFEKQYNKLEIVCYRHPKHLKVCVKNSTSVSFFNTLFGVLYAGNKRSLVYYILLQNHPQRYEIQIPFETMNFLCSLQCQINMNRVFYISARPRRQALSRHENIWCTSTE